MSFHSSNADGNGGAVLTLVRVLVSGKTETPELEMEEAHYSDWAPKKTRSLSALRESSNVFSSQPSVVFVQDGERSPINPWINVLFAIVPVAFFIYAVPTALESFAAHHFSPWVSTILPGDLTGCSWLALILRMRVLGLLLYVFLTASESTLYAFNLVDARQLLWLTDLVPALFVAGIMAARSKRRHS
jgi:hypothetical protein